MAGLLNFLNLSQCLLNHSEQDAHTWLSSKLSLTVHVVEGLGFPKSTRNCAPVIGLPEPPSYDLIRPSECAREELPHEYFDYVLEFGYPLNPKRHADRFEDAPSTKKSRDPYGGGTLGNTLL